MEDLKLQRPYVRQGLSIGLVFSEEERGAKDEALHALGGVFYNLVRAAGAVPVELEVHVLLQGEELGNLLAHVGQVHLACVAGVHGHDQDFFDDAQHLHDGLYGGAGVDGDAGNHSGVDDGLEGGGGVVLRLRMDVDRVALPQMLQEDADAVVGVLYHQVHVQGLCRGGGYVAHVVQGHGEVGDVAAVHDVYVEGVDAGFFQVFYFPLQVAVVGAHHGGCQLELHKSLLFEDMRNRLQITVITTATL